MVVDQIFRVFKGFEVAINRFLVRIIVRIHAHSEINTEQKKALNVAFAVVTCVC